MPSILSKIRTKGPKTSKLTNLKNTQASSSSPAKEKAISPADNRAGVYR